MDKTYCIFKKSYKGDLKIDKIVISDGYPIRDRLVIRAYYKGEYVFMYDTIDTVLDHHFDHLENVIKAGGLIDLRGKRCKP